MTGYAYNETETADFNYSIELKSYNSRYLDMSIYLPPYLGRLESRFRQKIDSRIQRGKIELSVKVKRLNHRAEVSVDSGLAASLKTAFEELIRSTGITESVPLSLIASQPGVISVQDSIDIEYYWELITPLFETTLEQFVQDRIREGANLKKDVLHRIGILEQSSAVFESMQGEMEAVFKENIVRRFHEALGNEIDEQRVLTETASLLVKHTISEEIIRLKSHIESLKAELETDGAPGRKIDFICQELNREINTIGSKNQNLEAGKSVIDAKDALESIREQARNIE
jgi:uncharacterized protein (TIGR00255 family)